MDINEFDLSKIIKRNDGSYVIDNGLYHVPNFGEYAELWKQVNNYAKEHKDVVVAEEKAVMISNDENNIKEELTDFIQMKLDEFAREKNYDNIISVCSYYNSTDPQFKKEAEYCIVLRDTTWRKAYMILDDVEKGKRSIPSKEELLKELPLYKASWEDVK